MGFTLKLNQALTRIAVGIVLVLLCLISGYLALAHFVVNTLSSSEVVVTRSTLVTAAAYFTGSARLQARVAAVELAESMGEEETLRQAEAAALSAVRLAPWNSNHHLLLASAKSLQGDFEAAESSLRTAVTMAPHYPQVYWQLANLLVRRDKVDDALQAFQAAIRFDPSARLLPASLEIMWTIAEGKTEKLVEAVGNNPKNVLALAQFLLQQNRLPEAIALFKSLDRQQLRDLSATTDVLNALIAQGEIVLARELWGTLNDETGSPASPLSNGGFEQDSDPKLPHFAWQLSQSQYAVPVVDTSIAHSGQRSLRISFTGKDTTVLDREVRQMLVVKPGTRYVLEYYAKTDNLITTEGVRVVISDVDSSATLASSTPLLTGTADWQAFAVEFVAPAKANAVLLTIKRTPKFSYDEPTKGRVWFDDFTLREKGAS